MRKHTVLFLFLVLCLLHKSEAQTTAIPDSNFEQALIDLGIDSDSTVNGHVLTSDVDSVDDLTVFNKNIASLSGIQDFVNLENLNCSNNRIRSMDLSGLLNLKELNCASNLLDTLDISSNSKLEKIYCQDNLLTTLNVTDNTLLKQLDVTSNQIVIINTAQNDSLISLKASNNQLSSLSVSTNTVLEELACSNNQIDSLYLLNNTFLRTLLTASNQLDSLNLSNNDSLIIVDVSGNQLRNLDVSNNLLLTNLVCSKNQLSTLDLSNNDSLTLLDVSNNQFKLIPLANNKKLEQFVCASNQVEALDLSENVNLVLLDASENLLSNLDLVANDSLTSIDISNNQLQLLNIQNGYNSDITSFNATNNQELLCILVDDTNAIGENWIKDDIASYNEICNALTYIPDDNFEQALIDFGFDTGTPNNYVLTANIDTVKTLHIAGMQIRDLTGLKDFTALTLLDCSNNLLYNLDVSSLKNLDSLNCSYNDSLTSLDLRNIQDSLVWLDATLDSLLTCITVDDVAAADTSTNWMKDSTASYSLDCTTNKTYIPDDNFEQALIDLGYDKGALDDYVVTDSINNIRILDVSNRNISDLKGIESFTLLDSLNCSSNNLTSLDISPLDSLRKLSCYSNYLSNLDVTANDSLLQLICGDNQLANLDVSKNTALLQLVCDANNLTQLDLTNNLKLLSLNCGSNNITNAGLFLDSNIFLIQLLCPNNKLAAIDINQNIFLTDLDCSGNYLSLLDLSENVLLVRLNCSLNKLSTLDVEKNKFLLEVECNSNQFNSLDFSENGFLLNLSADDNRLNAINISNNDSLRRLSIAGNKLATLNISDKIKLNYLNCDGNLISALNLDANYSLVYLSLANNKVTDLKTDNLAQLNYLNCSGNKIDSLPLFNNLALTELRCAANNIRNLDLVSNLKMRLLDVSNNRLTQIELNGLDSLRKLECTGNNLTSLFLTNNKALKSLNCSGNNLISINIKNGNNDSLSIFNATNNPDLTCIEVDDPNLIGENWLKDSTASYCLNCHYYETYVPDDNFEAALATITGEDDNNDDYILTAKIDTQISLNVSNKNIYNLSGIEDFEDLEILNASNNNVDSLDLSQNQKLRSLNVSGNLLDTLAIGGNTQMEILYVANNQLPIIITDSLEFLRILHVDSNQLTDLILTNNPALEALTCSFNQLVSLSVNNGNNTHLVTFDATNNPGLTCIEVDDPNSVPLSWQKDNIASYSKDCHYYETYVPDDAFEQALIDAGYDYEGTDSLDDYVPIFRIRNVEDLNLEGKGIKDLTGLQDFSNLSSLNLRGNEITSIDIGSHQELKTLIVAKNKLMELDLTENSLLEVLDCSSNQLTNIDLSANPLIRILNLDENAFVTINVENNINLSHLDCSHTGVSFLDLHNNVNLVELTANHNDGLLSVNIQNGNNALLMDLNLKFNPKLNCILVDNRDSAYSYSNWQKDNTSFYKTICSDDDNDGVSNADDQCPTTPFGNAVDLFGCSILVLPNNNFKVLVTGEVCRSSNNGKINISTVEKHNYEASITVDGTEREYHFTDSVEIRNLRAGTYELCLSVDGYPDFVRCFEIVISEPVDLSVLERVIPQDNKVSLSLSGGAVYTIELNGFAFKTTKDSITLNLEKGNNRIVIRTGALCQGIYEKNIFIGNDLVYYPNPYDQNFTVYMGRAYSGNVYVNMYSNSGKLVYSKLLSVHNGMVHIHNGTLPAGIYTVSIRTKRKPFTFKILKK